MLGLKKQANLVFIQLVLIGMVGGAVFGWAVTVVWPKLWWLVQAAWSKADSLCGCLGHWSFYDHPYIFSLIALTGLALFLLFLAVAVRAMRLALSTNRFVRFNLNKRRSGLSLKLEKAARASGLQGRVVEIKERGAVIFCYGLWRPRVCVSQGVVKKLNHDELATVLRHEKYHLSVYEPLRLFAVKIISQVLAFVPGVSKLAANYMVLSELAADERATDGFRNKLFLARALEKIMRLKEESVYQASLAVSFFSVIDERVNKLVEDNYQVPVRVWGLRVTVVLTFILLLGAVFYWPVNLTQGAGLRHSGQSCSRFSQQTENYKCEMSWLSFECNMQSEGGWSLALTCDN